MWIGRICVAAALMGVGQAQGLGTDTTVVDGFDCGVLPKDLLERSLAAGEDLFLPGRAEEFGWRPWDEAFEAATGLGEATLLQTPPPNTMGYDRVIYQRIDVDQDGKDELVALAEYLQGTQRYRIDYELHLLCDGADWKVETCDGTTARANGYKFRMSSGRGQNLGYYEMTNLPGNFTGIIPERHVGIFALGVVFLSIRDMPHVAATQRFYSDESHTVPLFGATIWPVEAEQFGNPHFCTWRE
jgi:hypothetical protein